MFGVSSARELRVLVKGIEDVILSYRLYYETRGFVKENHVILK